MSEESFISIYLSSEINTINNDAQFAKPMRIHVAKIDTQAQAIKQICSSIKILLPALIVDISVTCKSTR